MGKHNFENIKKQAYLLKNEQTRRVFESLPFRQYLKGNRGI